MVVDARRCPSTADPQTLSAVTLAGGSWPWGGGRSSKRDLRDTRDLRDSGRFEIFRRPADPNTDKNTDTRTDIDKQRQTRTP